ncbi:MAG: hypothetical protein JXA67_00160 [Micromonosporaceae bacterium]|nr:hypothetical protein [Micromonosporaceae bacterium]
MSQTNPASAESPRDPASQRPDPVESDIEDALDPGRFIPDETCFGFVDGLEAALATIGGLVATDPDRAATLYETFLAGCCEKAEEVDDSSGSFGMFAQSLISGWVTARQAAGACPQQTVARLLAWVDTDQYGFCYRLEHEIAPVLDEAGLTAYIDQIQARLTTAEQTYAASGESDRASRGARARWAEVLRALHTARGDLDAYVELAERTGLTTADCLAVANLLVTRDDAAQALSWVERGLALDAQLQHGSMAGYDLRKLKPQLLVGLGQGEQALDIAWAGYQQHPSQYSYDQLMAFVPEAERPTWHTRAIAAALDGERYLPSVIDLLLHTDETEHLASVAADASDTVLEGIGHHTAERVAAALEAARPDQAARIWRAQGMRILNPGKSKYYDAALRYFDQARRCYQQAGQSDRWQEVVDEVSTEHSRKKGFLARFGPIATRTTEAEPAPQPSFLDRARTRWTPADTGP